MMAKRFERSAATTSIELVGSTTARMPATRSRTSWVAYTSELVSGRNGMLAAVNADSSAGNESRDGINTAMSRSWAGRQASFNRRPSGPTPPGSANTGHSSSMIRHTIAATSAASISRIRPTPNVLS